MTVFRDWPRTLRPASYRGVGFFVEQDSIETGRRLEVHEFPHRDTPYVEDLGRSANKIQVTAYVLSDAADSEEKALRSACDRGGAARLVLPTDRLQAHCDKCTREFHKDKLGYVAFKLSFVRDGSASGPFPIQFLASQVSGLVGGLAAPLLEAFEAVYQGLRVPSFVLDAATASLREVAAIAESAASTIPMAVDRIPELTRAANALYVDAGTLARAGSVGQSHSATSYIAIASQVSAAPLVTSIVNLIGEIGAAGGVAEGHRALEPFLSYGLDASPAPLSIWRVLEQRNTAAIASVVRMSALASLADIVSVKVYADPREVRQARADVAELFDAEMHRLVPGRDHKLYTALSGISGATSALLSRRLADMAPVVIAESPRSMPSLWWANRLYGGPDRAGEIVTRNRVIHPSFMPPEFEALAR